MGNIVKKGSEVKSSFFGCDACIGEKNVKSKYSEIIVGEFESNPKKNLKWPQKITVNSRWFQRVNNTIIFKERKV